MIRCVLRSRLVHCKAIFMSDDSELPRITRLPGSLCGGLAKARISVVSDAGKIAKARR
jgi:hypothetical protein